MQLELEDKVAIVTGGSEGIGLASALRLAQHGLDILVNNAGTGRAAHFETVTDATWQADLDVKLHAAIHTTRAALPHLKVSKDLAEHRILVNTVSVGVIKSAQHERRARELGVALGDHYAELGKNVPLGRVGEADEVANLIVFLASAAASYVTGTSTNIDGGTSSAV
jgi:3-oxoacyl-[acyl-carrier protein] reductase